MIPSSLSFFAVFSRSIRSPLSYFVAFSEFFVVFCGSFAVFCRIALLEQNLHKLGRARFFLPESLCSHAEFNSICGKPQKVVTSLRLKHLVFAPSWKLRALPNDVSDVIPIV